MAQALLAPADEGPGPRRLSIEEYERLPDDLFPEGERAELIEGLIYTKVSQNDPHITALRAVQAALLEAFGAGFNLSIQTPLKLGQDSKPEPDVTVLRGTWRDYDGCRPDPQADVPLVVEVSDTSLAEDRGRKARLYARHGIPEYWIVNLGDRALEVRRRPREDGYAETMVLKEGESAEANGRAVEVSDVLPKADAS